MHRTYVQALHLCFAALAAVALVLTATLTPHLGVGPRVAAAAACPADKSHLVPWRGGRWFLAGMNVPWQNGGFGADFSTVEAWGQHTYSSASTAAMFSNLKAKGANSVRWWVFADGRGAPEFANGYVSGFDATTLPSMADAIKQAEQHGIYITFTLWSFDMLYANSNGIGGNQQGLFTDSAKRKAFIDKAVIPMLKYPVPGTSYTIGTHPNVISWEVINEPEWGVSESGSVRSSITQPASLAQMQRFIAEVTGAIHRNSNQLVTVGAAAMKWNSTGAPGAVGNWYSDAALRQYDPDGALDYYQVHYYSWTNGDANWSYSPLRVSWQQGAFDKPVVIGELPANASGAGMGVQQMLETIYGNCYAGAWGWSYDGVDNAGRWADMAEPLAALRAAHPDTINIVPGGSTTPPPATATPAPASPTAQATATTPPVSGAGHIVYGDALGSGWLNWSWNTNAVLNATAPVQSGAQSVAVTYGGNWAGFRVHTNAPVATAGLGKISFWAHGGATGGQALQLYIESGNGVGSQAVRLPALKANTWTLMEVPLSQLGSPAQISDIAIQEAGGTVFSTFYVDQIVIAPATATPLPATATPLPATATPLPATATPIPATATALPATATRVPATATPIPATATAIPATATRVPATATPASGATTKVLYDETLASGWQSWSWSTKVVLNYGTVVKAGQRSIAVTHQAQWAGFKLHTDTPVATTGLTKVRFWLHGGSSGGQSLQLYLENKSWRSPIVKLATPRAGAWVLVEVPLSQLGSPAQIGDIIIHEAGGALNRTFYVDQIELAP